MMLQQFELGEHYCPWTEGLASYRVLDSQRFCIACGEDHEVNA